MKTANSCPACNNTNSKPAPHPLYKICSGCSAVYQYKEINPISDYYATTSTLPSYHKQSGNYKNYLTTTSKYITPESTIIDLGGGDGTFLEIVNNNYTHKDSGIIESSPTAKKILRKNGIKVYEPEILQRDSPKTIFCFQVLEHIEDPIQFLTDLYIKKNDTLIITSPATDSSSFKRCGSIWRSYSPSHHLVLYNKRSLENILNKAGLSLIDYSFCYSGSNHHNFALNLYQNAKKLAIWLLRIIIKGYKPRPGFHGKNSFLAICTKLDSQ